MKIIAVQGHSQNNQKLYNLTIKNHIDYFNKYEIDFITKVENYSPFIKFEQILWLLQKYDYVFTIGSDCLFTNLNKNIMQFVDLNKHLNVCQEGTTISKTNGEIIFFKNGCQQILKQLDVIQKQLNNIQFGFQSILNLIYKDQFQWFNNNINLIEAGTLQNYWFEGCQLQFRKKYINNMEKLLWKPNDFILHTFGGNNDYKFQTIKNFMKKHNF